jgi:hypothetical protein
MPMLKWDAGILSSTTEEEREQMQNVFDTAFWTLNANHKLSPDSDIPLSPAGANKSERHAFAHLENGKWKAELR